MNFSVILDVVISFSFIYLVLSLVASEIQELITTVLQWRSRHLKYSIAKLFDENNNGTELTEKLWESSLIKSLYQTGKFKPKPVKFEGPSYIDGKLFSEALLCIIFDCDDNFPETIDRAIERIKDTPLIKSENLKTNLLSLGKLAKVKVEAGQNEFRQFQHEIENWFDNSMARASGAYKRNAKGVALIIAFVLAIVVNADTVYILNSLSKNGTLRQSINQVAENVILSNSEAVSSCLATAESDANQNQCLNPIKNQIDTTFNDLSPLPIGWDLSNPWNRQFNPLTPKAIFKVFIGWGVSAVAISMGAPFWFEFLNKFVNIRNTGKKPNNSQ
ncbi:conserved hypothetical protein [Gloeothece citriformis PCC 7424]|uniref:Uncharacterized protein n=1 Tax=Gloeothece citriformis (strain PCC 7424) TaxID=65393 RepID=B7KBV2_GLOC7|nr:hypothetical protein [Gloeothece citriformis]ACK73080.1 conserved hypothetical protein [Gloeothece citriformis PCC 7424]